MDDKFVKSFVKKCNESTFNARRLISQLTPDEVIELKAKMSARSVHVDKIVVIFIPFLALALSVLPLLVEMPDAPKEYIGYIAVGLLVAGAIAVFKHAWNQCTKTTKIERMKVYLEEYGRRQTNFPPMESFEQLKNRQREEQENMLVALKKEQERIDTQVRLLEADLKE